MFYDESTTVRLGVSRPTGARRNRTPRTGVGVAFTRVRRSGRPVLIVQGDVDDTAAADFARALSHLISDAESVAFVDLAGVTRFDVAASGELEDADRAARRTGLDLIVAPAPACGARLGDDGLPRAAGVGYPYPRQGKNGEREVMANGQATFRRSDDAGVRTLAIAGEIDMAVDSEFRHELGALIAGASAAVFVDLSAITFMDSAGVHALVDTARSATAAHTRVVLVSASRPCRMVLEMTGVWELFESDAESDVSSRWDAGSDQRGPTESVSAPPTSGPVSPAPGHRTTRE